MAKVTGKLGVWDVPVAHMWKDAGGGFICRPTPIIGRETLIATIGSCFASELATAMERLGLRGAMHPAGLFYTSSSIRQEFERIFAGKVLEEEAWAVRNGLVNPLMDPGRVFRTDAELKARCRELDERASQLFSSAEVIVVTLGLIESWVSPKSGLHYRQIPHPDVFPSLGAEFHRLSVSEIREDLERIHDLVTEHTRASLVVTVSPIPLHVTFTSLDVRVANQDSKSKLRAAVSEFVSEHDDVSYFHSYELVVCSPEQAALLCEDGRHLKRSAVDGIVTQFLAQFGQGMGPTEMGGGHGVAGAVARETNRFAKTRIGRWLRRRDRSA